MTLTSLDLQPRSVLLDRSAAARRPLRSWRVPVAAVVALERDATVWQGWRVRKIAGGAIRLTPGESAILDFGEHVVGAFLCHAESACRLRLEPAEVPAELGDRWQDHAAVFGDGSRPQRSWSPVDWNHPGGAQTGAGRHALRYLRVTLLEAAAPVALTDCAVLATSAVDPQPVPPPRGLSLRLTAIDRVSQITLRNCLQDVFEDGPKRDQRLWLGDLRLQALLAYQVCDATDLVRRCLYLHAACIDAEGMVPPCVFMHPEPNFSATPIPDYAALFGATLADYVVATGDRATGHELLSLAVHQCDLMARHCDAEGVWRDPGGQWLFIDWCNDLDREAAEHATLAYACGRVAELARELGEEAVAARLLKRKGDLLAAADARLYDAECGLYRSGPGGQLSVASQVWMVLAGARVGAAAAALLRRVLDDPAALRPGCPYLQHHLVEALLSSGCVREARDEIERVWGGMLDRGADTFWEVFDPADAHRSPYRSHLFNSYCHAWSCTPAWFIRHPQYGPLLAAAEEETR